MKRAIVVLAVIAGCPSCATAHGGPAPACAPAPATDGVTGMAGVETFNRAMTDAMRAMNDPATFALWEDDGVSLIPGAAPLVGKAAIAAMVRDVEAKNPGLRMQSFEMKCGGIEVSGDLAHEYCDEHQVVELGPGKPLFDGHGRMLFVLHRGADGVWRLRREVFQSMK